MRIGTIFIPVTAARVLHGSHDACVFIFEIVSSLSVRKQDRVKKCIYEIIVDRHTHFLVAFQVHHDVFSGIEIVICEVKHGSNVCACRFGVASARVGGVGVELEYVVADKFGVVWVISKYLI
jgi:hypothetical protein